ncbi:BRCA1-associated RING domain protein 1-like isoform X2 [Magnolia sinica]|uniref:BRCA1-associated RING domain protein 1-like isoform X2 n=1 Tax=Magnolia sinica TaxID=86752 RepID=UPI002657FF6D|nr:BRCA1-associated RING domain protein 1-like isoform X2 [Magnolia sinica]
MADFEICRRFLNPCLLHLQKMGLELKCPICLNLLSQPMLLPCNHIFCRSCISRPMEFGLKCLVCKSPFVNQDLRFAPHMETMVSIYKSLDAAFGDVEKSSNHHPVPSNLDIVDASRREQKQNLHRENSSNVQTYLPSFLANKRVQASLHPTKNEVETPQSLVKSSKPRNDGESADCMGLGNQNGEYSANEEALVNGRDPASSPFSLLRDPEYEERGTHERDVSQLVQSSPDSPPSFGDIKDSDDDSNDQGSEHSAERLSSKGASKKGPEDGASLEAEVVLRCSPITDPSVRKSDVSRKLNVRSPSSSEGDQTRDSKRQKKSDCGLPDLLSNPSSSTNTGPAAVCAFCQSSKYSKATGPMLHYSNGTEIEADQAIHSNALHVHKQCVEWAPQVYFVGETVKNLEVEVARGAKIKCSSCGKKGAALGCYAKSCRRSFHVPCAVEILECRWDFDNFLMLCPAHSSLKLPNERSKSGKKIRANKFSVAQPAYPQTSEDLPSSTTQKSNKHWTASPDATREWVLCGSALSSAEKDLVSEFASLTGATVTKVWNTNVTHVIAAADDMGACSRTLKFLMAILNGRWILKIDWIKACMEAKHPVCEEPYEISSDVHGSCDGPKNSRIRVIEKAPKLFSGLNFYFSGDFMPSYKGYLQDLVVAAGGTVLVKKDMVPQTSSTRTTPTSTLVIYSLDPSQECKSGQLSSVVQQRLEEAEAIAAETGSQAVGHAWLLESIAACKLQSLDL